MSNVKEDIEAVISCADYLSEEYITRKLLTILGDIDVLEDVINQKANDGMSRMTGDE
jgi:hypothetical protein